MSTKAKKITNIVVEVVLWIFLVFAALMTVLAFAAQSSSREYPVLGDTCLLTVESDSMAKEGGFYKGDLIISKIVKDEDKKNMKVGDVVSFYINVSADGEDRKVLNTHRIVEVYEEHGQVYYRTKGDNNEVADTPIHNLDVEAKWTGTRLAGVGSAILFLRSSVGFLVCIVLPLLAFFVYELVRMIRTILAVKNKDKKVITAQEEEEMKQKAVEEYLARKAAEEQKVVAEEKSETKEENKEEVKDTEE